MKKYLLSIGAVLSPVLAFAEPATIFSSATDAVEAAGTWVGTGLIAMLVIPVAFLGYKVVKRVLSK